MELAGTGTAFHSADIGLVVKNGSGKKMRKETEKNHTTKNENPPASSSL